MPTRTLHPDTIVVETNLTGSVTAIQDDPSSPDANWLTATSTGANTDLRVTFPTPPANPFGTQTFRVLVRKNGTASQNPTATVYLYENGTQLATVVAATSVSSSTGVVLTGTWNASSLTDPTGAGVECRVLGTFGQNGSKTSTIDVGAVAWDVPVIVSTSGADSLSGSDSAVRAATLSRNPFDTLTSIDVPGRALATARGIVDTTTVSESLSGKKILGRFGNDSTTIGEVLARTMLFSRARSEATTGSDSLQRAAMLPRARSESTTIGDAVARGVTLSRKPSEPLPTADSLSRLVAVARSQANAVTGADSTARSVLFPRATSEPLSTSAVLTRLVFLTRSVGELLTGVDAPTGQVFHYLFGSESVPPATDSVTRALVLPRDSDESVLGHDGAPVLVLSLHAGVTEPIPTSEAVSRLVALRRGQSDTVVTSDATHQIMTRLRSVADGLLTRDHLGIRLSLHMTVTDALSVGDVVLGTPIVPVTASDITVVSDEAGGLTILHRAGDRALSQMAFLYAGEQRRGGATQVLYRL